VFFILQPILRRAPWIAAEQLLARVAELDGRARSTSEVGEIARALARPRSEPFEDPDARRLVIGAVISDATFP
jgi:hypothetical protein